MCGKIINKWHSLFCTFPLQKFFILRVIGHVWILVVLYRVGLSSVSNFAGKEELCEEFE